MKSESARRDRALITGVTGQDGYYLAQYLVEEGYEVYGLVRSEASKRVSEVTGIPEEVILVHGDLRSYRSLVNALRISYPNEIYNLAGLSSVGLSFDRPRLTLDVNASGVMRLLDAVLEICGSDVRVFQASSSEMFGEASEWPQSEKTPLNPISPYGVSKACAHQMCRVYRGAYGLFVSCGIMFNHESVRRPLRFVTRKIAHAVARISLGMQDKLPLGNIDVRRDWGFAGDYVRAMHMILQCEDPGDFVVATGVDRPLREFIATAFKTVELDDWERYVVIEDCLIRGTDLLRTVGDPSKMRSLGWVPEVGFEEMVGEMVRWELERVRE